MIVNCLMGSNMTECDQLEDTLVAMAMNATDMLAEQCKILFNPTLFKLVLSVCQILLFIELYQNNTIIEYE